MGAILPFRSPSQLVEELTQISNDACGRSEDPRYVVDVPGLNLCADELDPYKTVFNVTIPYSCIKNGIERL